MPFETGKNPFAADPRAAEVWDECFERLEAIAGQDAGFFDLAVHALVEAWLNASDPDFARQAEYPGDGQQGPRFREKVEQHLERRGNPDYRSSLNGFSYSYRATNAVRHHFAALPESVAKSVGENLVVLAAKAGLGTASGRRRISERVAAWEGRVELHCHDEVLARIRYLESAQAEGGAALQARLLELDERTKAFEALEREHAALQSAYTGLSAVAAGRREEREDFRELKRELFARKEALRKAEGELAARAADAAYLAELRAMHHASRTRVEYEQTLLRLSAEQEDVLGSFVPGQSFLVRGAAGTGKTLVLLAAIRKLREEEANSLGVLPARKVLLVTYTKTLTRYSRYLAELLLHGRQVDEVRTLDSLILELGRAIVDPDHRLAFTEEERATAFEGLEEGERSELEDFIWAGGHSRESYLDPGTRRIGRLRPIPMSERERIWDKGEVLLGAMGKRKLYSFNGLRTAIWRRLEAGVQPPAAFAMDVIAVDEVQDLAPIDLRILARLSPSLVMAGDAGQRIMKQGFSFRALGIDIANRSRTLSRNFRNTRPIHGLATAFLAATGLSDEEATSCVAYRDGLPPRLFRYADRGQAMELLLESLRFYREVLEYGESSLAVLTSGFSGADLEGLAAELRKRGSKVLPIREDEAWIEKDGIRLSTIQSAKGLDFPVVIALFGKFHEDWEAATEARRSAKANLAYVGLTRALENLTVIMPEKTQDHVFEALAAGFKASEGRDGGPEAQGKAARDPA